MWLLIALIIVGFGLAAYFVLFQSRKIEEPHDTYVCDICGERECLCHKEDSSGSN
jgi:hypothetical protein